MFIGRFQQIHIRRNQPVLSMSREHNYVDRLLLLGPVHLHCYIDLEICHESLGENKIHRFKKNLSIKYVFIPLTHGVVLLYLQSTEWLKI